MAGKGDTKPRGGKVEKKKAAKKEKDPNAPKRPLSGYMIFTGDKRKEIMAAHPEFKASDVAKECGRLWSDMNDSQKKVFNDRGAKEKEKYVKAKAAYEAGGGGAGASPTKKKPAPKAGSSDDE